MRMNLEQLNTELLRRERTTVDYLVDSHRVTAEAGSVDPGEHGIPRAVITGPNPSPDMMTDVVLRLPDVEDPLPLTPHGIVQVSQKLGVPKIYVDRLVEKNKHALLATNFNAWLGDRERDLYRIQDGRIRAMLSTRYRPMDNRPVLLAALTFLQGKGVDITDCYLTEERMYVKAHVPHLRQEIVKGDKVIPGIIISNSEVGSGSLRVEPYLYRLVCSNGMIGKDALTRVHVGGELGDIEGLLKADTIAAQAEATTLIVRDVIDGVFSPDRLAAWIEELRVGTKVKIERPTEAIGWAMKRFNIPKSLEDSVLDQFIKGTDSSQWGLANAVTAVARTREDVTSQVELERIGGEIAVIDLSKHAPQLLAEA